MLTWLYLSQMQSGRLSQRGSQQNEAQMQGYGLNPSYSSQYLNEQAPMVSIKPPAGTSLKAICQKQDTQF